VTERLFQCDAYLKVCAATVIASHADGIILDRTVFYPLGGGQPGDTGLLRLHRGEISIVDTRHGREGQLIHVPAPDSRLPDVGDKVEAVIDWDRRYAHMRMHTGLHLLGVALPYGVTGGNITAVRSRLDFDMPESVDKAETQTQLNRLIRENHPVDSFWIDEDELEARPELIRTLSVRPPRGVGKIRLLRITDIDLQPCGGTHVRTTGEIGPMKVTRIEKKGRRNRRVYLEFDNGRDA
jgi:misacylated tRNA(Ala) deacylase